MAKHAHEDEKFSFSAAQMALATKNPRDLRYKQGMLDALTVVSRLQTENVGIDQVQQLLDGLPSSWDQSIGRAYVTGFEDMYGMVCEMLTTQYAPETLHVAKSAGIPPKPLSKPRKGAHRAARGRKRV